MDSFGDRLRQAREKLNLSVDQVSRDTHIAKRHIEGLEREDFSGFPGETYTMGFLRNYALFLGLESDEMVAAYRSLRIQEQPVPMTELLEDKKGSRMLATIGIAVAALIVLAGVGYGVYRLASSGRSAPRATSPQAAKPQAAKPAAETAAYVLDQPAVVRWFAQGDRITVPFGTARIDLRVDRIEKEVYIELPGGVEIFGVGDKKRIDVDNDGKIDLQIQLNSIDATTGERRANIGLYKIARATDEPRAGTGATAEGAGTDTGTAAATDATGATGATGAAAAAATAAPAAGEGDTLAAPVRRLDLPVITLREAETAGPFSLTVSFSGRCLFRFQVDAADRETRLFLKGGTLQLEAQQTLKIWASNAGVVDARVAGKGLSLGRQGEVAAADIHWVRDPQTRKQRLRSFPLY